MLGLGNPDEIAKFVEKQLLDYTYTFPHALNVSLHLTLNSV